MSRTPETIADLLVESVDLDVEAATEAVETWIHGGYRPADYPSRTNALLRSVTPANGYDVLGILLAQ